MSLLSSQPMSSKVTDDQPIEARAGYAYSGHYSGYPSNQEQFTRGPTGGWNSETRVQNPYQPKIAPINVPGKTRNTPAINTPASNTPGKATNRPLNGLVSSPSKSSPLNGPVISPLNGPVSNSPSTPSANQSGSKSPALKVPGAGLSKMSPNGSIDSSFKLSTPNLSSSMLSANDVPHNARTPSPVRAKKPPQINTKVMTPQSRSATPNGDSPLGSPSLLYSPGRRCLSDKLKATPASYVRHSRVFSQSDLSFLDHHQLGVPLPHATPRSTSVRRSRSLMCMQNKLINDLLAPEVAPVVNLINALKMRTYATGDFQLPGQLSHGERIWFEVEAKLSGTELAIWRPAQDEFMVENGNDEFTPKYINLADAKIEVVNDRQVRILQDWQVDNTTLIQFHLAPELKHWLAAMYLAKYEHTALNEAYTAVLLSTKLSKMADVHLLLSKKRFEHTEWVNLRLPQVSNRWIKVFMVILALELKRLGLISIYTLDKLTKKNLLVHVANVVDVYNVYPEHPGMIDANGLMKLSGDIYISRAHEHLFSPHSFVPEPPSMSFFKRSSSHNSLSSMGSSPGNRSSSYFEVAPPLDSAEFKARGNRSRSNSEKGKLPKSFFGFGRSHGRDRSNSQNASSSSRTNSDPRLDAEVNRSMSVFVKKNRNQFVAASYLYLMPVLHPGVPAVQTMLRNYMHIIDVFQLYGRPELFVSDKTDPRSMLFALPSLPHYQYMTVDNATLLVSSVLPTAIAEQWVESNWVGAFKGELSRKLAGSKDGARAYKGLGDISKLYGDLDMDYGEVLSPSMSLQPPQLPVSAGSNLAYSGYDDNAYSSTSSLNRDKDPGNGSRSDSLEENDFSSYKSYKPPTTNVGQNPRSEPVKAFDNSLPSPSLGAPIALDSYGYQDDAAGPIAQLRLREEANGRVEPVGK